MSDFEDTPKYKLFRELCDDFKNGLIKGFDNSEFTKQFSSDKRYEVFVREAYVKQLKDYDELLKKLPSPEYIGYDDLEVGKTYHVADGLTHPTFTISEKITTEKGIYKYVYTPDSEKIDIGTFGQFFSRYKEGPWSPIST